MQTQTISVEYSDKLMSCQLCNLCSESNGNYTYMNNCNHSFHVLCLIDNAYLSSKMICPCCNMPYNDLRLSLAVAYKNKILNYF
jgi:hypothetical protein